MISIYETVEFDEELLNQILEFEIEKARKKDSLCCNSSAPSYIPTDTTPGKI